MKKRLISCLLALAMLLGAAPAAMAASDPAYADVPADHWAYAEIEKVTQAGLFQGVEENVFGMGQTMTRSQFVTTLCRLFGWEMVSPAEPSFSDCEPFRWYYAAVETALAEGAIPEYLSAFRPNDPITREEMASMLVRSLGYNALAGRMGGASLPFPDVKSNRGYIALAYDMGLITGHPDGTFQPDAPVTREQAAVVLFRLMILLDGKAPATGPLSYLDAASISDWAAGPVSGVTGAKVFYGSDGFFRPADNVTLQEMIVALWRIAQPHVETAAAAA